MDERQVLTNKLAYRSTMQFQLSLATLAAFVAVAVAVPSVSTHMYGIPTVAEPLHAVRGSRSAHVAG